jgi:hypothetical protein
MDVSNKKAQGAMEYLMTYAWAILILAVIGVTLWLLGVFGHRGGVNISEGFTKIKILDPSIKYSAGVEDNALEFTVVNTIGQTITDLQVASVEGSCTSESTDPEKQLDSTLGAGEIDHIWLTNCDRKAVGEQFLVKIEFSYSTTVAGIKTSRSDSGSIIGFVESP